MGKQIQLLQTTPEELAALIAKELSKQLEEIKKAIPHAEQLLTREQTAKLLDIDLSTLYYWTKQGKLKSYGISTRIYYKRGEIEKSLIQLSGDKNAEQGSSRTSILLEDAGISSALYNILKVARLNTLHEVANFGYWRVFKLRNMGVKRFAELENLMRHHNIEFSSP